MGSLHGPGCPGTYYRDSCWPLTQDIHLPLHPKCWVKGMRQHTYLHSVVTMVNFFNIMSSLIKSLAHNKPVLKGTHYYLLKYSDPGSITLKVSLISQVRAGGLNPKVFRLGSSDCAVTALRLRSADWCTQCTKHLTGAPGKCVPTKGQQIGPTM